MFGEVVGQVVCAFSPMDEKMSLFDAIANPVETHIHGFGSALFDSFVANASCAGIVGLDGCRWLWMPHVFKGGAEHCSFFAVEEESAKFGFGGGGEDGGHHGGMNVNCAVGGRRSGVGIGGTEGIGEWVAEEEKTAWARASFLLREIGGVAVDMEDHAAGVKAKDGGGMCGTVVEELCDGDCGGFGAVGLRGCEGTECDQHGAVDRSRVVKEGANDILQTCEGCGVEEWSGVFVGCVLYGCAVVGSDPGVWCVLRAGCRLV